MMPRDRDRIEPVAGSAATSASAVPRRHPTAFGRKAPQPGTPGLPRTVWGDTQIQTYPLAAEGLVGRPLSELVPAGLAQQVRYYLEKALRTGGLHLQPGPDGGTVVSCLFPRPAEPMACATQAASTASAVPKPLTQPISKEQTP